MIFSVNERCEVLQELVVVFVHHALAVFVAIRKLVEFRQVSVFLAPVEVFLRRRLRAAVRAHVVQDLVEVWLALRVRHVQLRPVCIACVLEIRVVRKFRNLDHVRYDRVQTALVVRNNHPDIRIRHQFADVRVRHADANRTAVVAVSVGFLDIHCRVIIK